MHIFNICSVLKALLYTASKVRHRLNNFTVKLSKLDFFLVTFIKRDKVVTIYSKFLFDYRKGKGPGKENAHIPLKCPHSLDHCGIFKRLGDKKCLSHIVTIPKSCSV